MDAFEFHIETNSPVPIIRQIQEQVKLAIAMGSLKRGDLLPPIRKVEAQTGVNRGQIHRAYVSLRQTGLLSPAPRNRTAVAISATAPDAISKKCQALSRDIIARARKLGVSPVSFARYLIRNAQEDERRYPFIAYVDPNKDTALQRAEQISRLWHTSVVGLSVGEYRHALKKDNKLRKVLVNHLFVDIVRPAAAQKKIDVIPVEITYTKQTIKALGRIKVSSILLLLPKHAVPSAGFIVQQLYKWIKNKKAIISWRLVDEIADFGQLLKEPQGELILVSPGARSKVPVELSRCSRVLVLRMDFDPKGLEIARIRAGVIV